MQIFGWGVEKGVKYWLVANSWNEDWGDAGEVVVEEEVLSGARRNKLTGWLQRRHLQDCARQGPLRHRVGRRRRPRVHYAQVSVGLPGGEWGAEGGAASCGRREDVGAETWSGLRVA